MILYFLEKCEASIQQQCERYSVIIFCLSYRQNKMFLHHPPPSSVPQPLYILCTLDLLLNYPNLDSIVVLNTQPTFHDYQGNRWSLHTLQHFKPTGLARITRTFHSWNSYAKYLNPQDTDTLLMMTASLSMSK